MLSIGRAAAVAGEEQLAPDREGICRDFDNIADRGQKAGIVDRRLQRVARTRQILFRLHAALGFRTPSAIERSLGAGRSGLIPHPYTLPASPGRARSERRLVG